MIFTRIEIDNLFGFKNSVLDLTYKTKIKNNPIEYEYLEGVEGFYYKKVCIISGANATGKTSLGRIMLLVQRYVYLGSYDKDSIKQIICNKQKNARIKVDFVTKHCIDDTVKHKMHQLSIDISPDGDIIQNIYVSVNITKNDRNSSVQKKIDTLLLQQEKGIKSRELLFEFGTASSGWYYIFSENETSSSSIIKFDTHFKSSRSILEKILKSFDTSIDRVVEVAGENKKSEKIETMGFNVMFKNSDSILIDLSGNIANPKRFSKGTYDAIEVALLINRVMQDQSWDSSPRKKSFVDDGNIYFLDEKMAYAHSDLERAIVNLIVMRLPIFSQFFYTTHNYDVLELGFPIHSFSFLRKEFEETIIVNPSLTHKKNDRKLVHYVRRDVFQTLPDVDQINSLLWE